MTNLDIHLHELVLANRILSREGVVDAFGHASIRHPDDPEKFFLSRSLAPELVCAGDLMVYDLDGAPIDQQDRAVYAERFIHAGIYETRRDVNAVIHNHAYTVVPFTVTDAPLRPISHTSGIIGEVSPVWDIADNFGDTDMLVVNMDQARDLAKTLGGGTTALMRGHGCVVAGGTIREAVMTAVYLLVNARLLLDALRLGTPKYLSPGEVALSTERHRKPLGMNRAWDYWVSRADTSDL